MGVLHLQLQITFTDMFTVLNVQQHLVLVGHQCGLNGLLLTARHLLVELNSVFRLSTVCMKAKTDIANFFGTIPLFSLHERLSWHDTQESMIENDNQINDIIQE